jgi:arabinose-5-phosphate isomerase
LAKLAQRMNLMDLLKLAQETLRIEASALLDASQTLNESFLNAVELIAHTKGKLIITGVGKSGLVGAKMAATFASTGTPSFFLHPTEALHGDLGMIGKEDTLLAISSSGESEELTKILPHIKRFGTPLLAFTSKPTSSLGSYAKTIINISVTQEACPLNAAPTTSTTLTMALGDALAIALMHLKGFKQEDFASFHPGGSLGKKLFLTIEEMMRKKHLPIINNNTTLKDAIVVMSEGKLGTVLIVDKQNRLTALLSDGDLRRALMQESFDLNAPALTYATHHPLHTKETTMLASQALDFIEEKRIQLLPVVSEEMEPLGVVHLHDLINEGVTT